MNKAIVIVAILLALSLADSRYASAAGAAPLLTGASAFGDWHDDAPGVRRKITVAALPPPFATESAGNGPTIVSRPAGAELHVPPGFAVSEFASGIIHPRQIRTAPNGDLFVSESDSGRVRVLRPSADGAKLLRDSVFASELALPFGVAFWPPGPNPQFVYIAETDTVVRFSYRNGDLQARGPAETVVPHLLGAGSLRGSGHWTRDLVFTRDGSRMFISVGSFTNDGEHLAERDLPVVPDEKLRDKSYWDTAADFGDRHGLASLAPVERDRADVLEFTTAGHRIGVFASGLRNCVGMAVNPLDGTLWCSTNERDGLGDNLPPDYITQVHQNGFYGWPWFYIGNHADPHYQGAHPELGQHVIVPDVLLQAHSASLGITFYNASQFPSDYRGEIFAAEHGSWNRSRRTGYKIIRVILHDGKATGEYDDFMVGFVTQDGHVWGRPVGVAVGRDGSLFISDDVGNTIWRVSYSAKPSPARH